MFLPIFLGAAILFGAHAATHRHHAPSPICRTTLSPIYVCPVDDPTLRCVAGQAIQVRMTVCEANNAP